MPKGKTEEATPGFDVGIGAAGIGVFWARIDGAGVLGRDSGRRVVGSVRMKVCERLGEFGVEGLDFNTGVDFAFPRGAEAGTCVDF